MSRCDLAIVNGIVIVPEIGPLRVDLGIRDGVINTMSDSIPPSDADEVLDAGGLHVLPGAVDSHFHVGIYRPHSEDAASESASAVSGGVTTILSYFRTGSHYLNKVGSYREIFPEVLDLSRDRFWCDYSYHIAPMTTDQLDEIEWLVENGVASFKFYMFYKGLTLSADSTDGKTYTMAENYDLGHLYQLMVRIAAAARSRPERISLSLHCENPELIRVFIEQVKKEGLKGLEAYSKGRPPLTESLSIEEAGVLAKATLCPVNLLHLSSKDAVESAISLRRRYPELDILLETTLHHLMLNYEDLVGNEGKVNPPIRCKVDQEAVWKAVVDGEIDTVVSDHACCLEEKKQGDLWSALPGFGGTALLYPVLLSEGVRKRGLSLTRAVQLISNTPARRYGLFPRKGTIAIGSDADLVVADLNAERTVTAEQLASAQAFTPFAGVKLTGWPITTLVRGQVIFKDGRTQGTPGGQFVARPVISQATTRDATAPVTLGKPA
jgi:dihydroorotase-like cyclic amidohydrolase